MNQNILEEVSENLQRFLKSLRNSHWAPLGSEKTIDSNFKSALELERIFLEKEKSSELEDYLESNFNFKKPSDVLMQNILQNHQLDENLTLYAINKYISLYSKSDFSELMDKILSEIELRGQIFNLIEQFPDVDLDLYRLNNFLCDLLSSSDLKSKVLSSLKTQASVYLKAIKHSLNLYKDVLLEEMIVCLESQTDLRLWFMVMKEENIDTILDLCAQHKNFLNAVFKFFDNFANEIESTYDEELSVIYSHVNLDFEDFVRILKLFLSKKSIKKTVSDYLDTKTLNNKNFCFWVDVKTCL